MGRRNKCTGCQNQIHDIVITDTDSVQHLLNLEHDDPTVQHQAAMRLAHLSIAILLESEGAAFEADSVTTQLSEDDEALFTLNGRAFCFQRSRFPFYTELQDALRASEAAVARGEASIRLDAATQGDAALEALRRCARGAPCSSCSMGRARRE